ncbi:putative protein FAM172B [Heteronotia binoei]|uniref:putative protein FAM172B n=1 Tax=Heteronotia binoei TaxID=13085 RepID=UPI002930D99A|nr:putative protein FAM172B [Heteronotia binoei]XP_060090550.1 putative protein FAM172B [Heteronotia binoei]
MNWLKMNEDLSFRKLIYGSKCPEKLNYDFNKNGELRHVDTDEPFIFNYNNSCDSNHKRYEVLGYLITQYVYELLERVCKLQKIYIPIDALENEPKSFFFMSENVLRNCTTLVVLLQDRGVFHAGQWDQKATIHEGLQHGTQIPFITMALQSSWEVIVLNPNDNFLELKTEEKSCCVLKSTHVIPKKYNSSPEEHTVYVWDHFISKSTAGKVAFIAHGYGGLVFINLLMQRTSEVMNKVYAVALVDSAHHTMHQTQGNCQVQEWIQKHCRKWVSNNKPLDKAVGHSMNKDCPTVSAGTEKCSLALSSSLQSIFKYLKNELKVSAKAHLIRSPIGTRSRKVIKKT